MPPPEPVDIAELAERLNGATDAAKAAIRNFEGELEILGLEAQVPLPGGPERLYFSKLNNKFRVLLGNSTDTAKPATDWDRRGQADAAKGLDKLREALIAKALELIELLEGSV